MAQIRYGIIGLGNQGSTYMLGLFDKGQAKNAVVSAVCDINPVKTESVKAKTVNTDVVYFDNYIEMLDSGLCDAVLVETPHYQHPEMVIECLKRGIHVICEKPAGVYAKQVKEMNAVAEKSGAKFGMMFNQRTNCVYRKMRELIAAGEIGEIQRVTWIITDWYRTQYYYDSGNWRATWEGEGGGVLFNQCPHQLDLVQWVVGKLPKYVSGHCQYGKWHDIEVEDDVTAYFEYDNSATGMFITSTGETPGTNRFEVSGTGGKLLCENDKLFLYKNATDSIEHGKTVKSGFAKPKCEITEVETDGQNPQHIGIINNFTAALLGEEPLFVKGTDGLAGVELMNAIEYSGWHGGERVELPVDEDKYLEELTEKRKTSRFKNVVEAAAADTAGTY
ncbi:MAG: Gfo/Idh/MocA family oxidoreductase [Ruminococcaceae bacterium]|nr:Gfo/Idh/MocA family oxidoreductase [Oscillospiraceae bacterium]